MTADQLKSDLPSLLRSMRAEGAADMRERAAKLVEQAITADEGVIDIDGWWKNVYALADNIRCLPLDPDQEGE